MEARLPPCGAETGTKKKACTESAGLFKMVRLAGFEPTTPWFVAKYSNPTELQPLKH